MSKICKFHELWLNIKFIFCDYPKEGFFWRTAGSWTVQDKQLMNDYHEQKTQLWIIQVTTVLKIKSM